MNRRIRPILTPALQRVCGLVALVCALLITLWWSAWFGSADVPAMDILKAIVAFDDSREHLVIATIRLPRVLAGLLAGAGFATSGAIMQAITNNPLASPSLLGINAGAAFAVVLTMSLFETNGNGGFVWSALGGASLAATLVYCFGTIGAANASPVRLVLVGAALTAFLTSLTTAFLIFDQSTLDNVRLWTAGSLVGRTNQQIQTVLPFMLLGFAAALLFPRHLTTMGLGAEVARSLGQNPTVWRGFAAGVVILLAGSSVVLAGPIVFVGLVVPHIARLTVGADYRWILPYSAAIGSLLVVAADGLGRQLFGSQSFPVGVTIALIAAPFFVWLARSRTQETS